MNAEEVPRKCSAVNSDGSPCQAWAMHGSKPALCSVHAGRSYGPGAPQGNKNALKHGYYTQHFTEKEIADFEYLTEKSLTGELVLARTMIRRLAAYVTRDEATFEETATIMPLILLHTADERGFLGDDAWLELRSRQSVTCVVNGTQRDDGRGTGTGGRAQR